MSRRIFYFRSAIYPTYHTLSYKSTSLSIHEDVFHEMLIMARELVSTSQVLYQSKLQILDDMDINIQNFQICLLVSSLSLPQLQSLTQSLHEIIVVANQIKYKSLTPIHNDLIDLYNDANEKADCYKQYFLTTLSTYFEQRDDDDDEEEEEEEQEENLRYHYDRDESHLQHEEEKKLQEQKQDEKIKMSINSFYSVCDEIHELIIKNNERLTTLNTKSTNILQEARDILRKVYNRLENVSTAPVTTTTTTTSSSTSSSSR